MRVPRRPPLSLVVLLVHTVVVQVLTFVLRPTASYRALELDVSTPVLGLLGASFALVPLLLAIPAGHLTDRVGERRMMLCGAVLLMAACVCFLAAGGSVAGLILSSVLLGTGHLLAVVGQQALVANTAGPGRFDAVFGRYTFAASIGQAVGPGLIIVFGGGQTVPDTEAIFRGAILISAALVACSVGVQASNRPAAVEQGTHGVGSLLRLPGLFRALLTSCVILSAVDITLVYLPALGTERGLASGIVAFLLVVRAASSMVSRLFLGRLTARFGRRTMLLSSIAASVVGMAATPFPMPVWLLAVAVAVMGLGLGVGQPLTMSWLAESAPAGTRGRAMSLRLTGNRLGQVVLPSAVGLVAAGAGAPGVLWATAGSLAAVGVAARKLHRS